MLLCENKYLNTNLTNWVMWKNKLNNYESLLEAGNKGF